MYKYKHSNTNNVLQKMNIKADSNTFAL